MTGPESDIINILAVDDDEKNLKLIEALLSHHGYHVMAACNGTEALQVAEAQEIDVILLDVMMPGIDGYEVCRRLKEDKKTAHIPVILVTALHEREQKVFGIAAGANDYLTKPIDDEDLVLRVRNAARLKILHDQTKKNYVKLKELEQLRDDLTQMIVHDLRSPLSGLVGNLDLLQMTMEDIQVDPVLDEYVESAVSSAKTITMMIDNLLDVYKMEENQLELKISRNSMTSIIEQAVALVTALAKEYKLTINVTPKVVDCDCDSALMRRVISNLLGNAIKFTPPGGHINISAHKKEGSVYVQVADTGPGISADFHEKIFEKFGQVKMRQQNVKHSTGLGLTFCKLAIEAHGGAIGVKSDEGEGSTFWFEIPIQRHL